MVEKLKDSEWDSKGVTGPFMEAVFPWPKHFPWGPISQHHHARDRESSTRTYGDGSKLLHRLRSRFEIIRSKDIVQGLNPRRGPLIAAMSRTGFGGINWKRQGQWRGCCRKLWVWQGLGCWSWDLRANPRGAEKEKMFVNSWIEKEGMGENSGDREKFMKPMMHFFRFNFVAFIIELVIQGIFLFNF